MTIGSLVKLIEELDQDTELMVEVVKETGETAATYDIGFGLSEFGEFTLIVHE